MAIEQVGEELDVVLKVRFEIRRKTDEILIANGFKNLRGTADWKRFDKWEQEAMTQWCETQSQRFERSGYVAVMEELVGVPENAKRFRLGRQRITIHKK